MALTNWMSWEGGVDLCAATAPGLPMPNVLVHVARCVHTPVGSAPSGMVLFQPDPAKPPVAIGFVSTDAKVGAYFGPKIFAGTPFEGAPVHVGTIEIANELPRALRSRVSVAGHLFEVELAELGELALVHRAPAAMTPFTQQGGEAAARKASLRVDGKPVQLLVPPAGITGGPAAVWSPFEIGRAHV